MHRQFLRADCMPACIRVLSTLVASMPRSAKSSVADSSTLLWARALNPLAIC
jgi:hypothetical protein